MKNFLADYFKINANGFDSFWMFFNSIFCYFCEFYSESYFITRNFYEEYYC